MLRRHPCLTPDHSTSLGKHRRAIDMVPLIRTCAPSRAEARQDNVAELAKELLGKRFRRC
jgi:hypothetical protein